MASQLKILFVVASVQQDEDEIETGEKGCWQVDILLGRLRRIISK